MMNKQSINRSWLLLLQFALIMLMVFPEANAQLPSGFQRVTVASGLSSPSAIAFLPDGRLLVCQKGGSLRVISTTGTVSTAITLSVNTSGERGLIGVAVDPNFSSNNFIYLYYSTSGTTKNRVSRFTMTGNTAGSESIVYDFPNDGHMYHNGGGLEFGADGTLYVLSGDDTNGSNASNLDSPFGKVLRITTSGGIPAGNPFTGGAVRSRVWSYGLRNPYTLDLDNGVSNKLFVNDVGNATWEEINDATVGGRNFGWPTSEGSGSNMVYRYATNRTDPPPTGQGCAISGGTFFNGAISNYPSIYDGKYFFLDYCGAWIDYINPAAAAPRPRNGFATGQPIGLVYIKQNPNDGNLYYLNISNGSVYKIIYTLNTCPVITSQPIDKTVSAGSTVTFSVTASNSPTGYQWRKNGVNIVNGGKYSGATTATLTITNVSDLEEGGYSVVVSKTNCTSLTSRTANLTVTVPNSAPNATITSPANGSTWRAGQTIAYSGTATDPEQGTLPASAFEWFLDFRHENHGHGGPELADGVTSGNWTIDTQGHPETNIWYRLYLVVTDAQGAKDTSMVELFPVLSPLTLQTSPSGLKVTLDNIPTNTPLTTQAVSGSTRPIGPVSPQTVNGVTYVFDSWAHGGPANQTITINDNPATYTANYRVAPTPTVLTPTHDAYVRDGTNAGITHGTTDPTLLITKISPAGQLNNARESYLMFNTASVTGTVSNVVLRVYGKVDGTAVPNVSTGVYSVANTTWTESTITWNNKPATSAGTLATASVSNAAFAYYDFDVTSYVASERAAGRNTVAFAMKSLQAHDPRVFWNSKEFGSNPPQLSIIADGGPVNPPPTASITSPANGATFTQPVNVTINASASDDGSVTKVEFFEDGNKLGEDLTSPYSFTWNAVPAGTHVLTAVATDNLGALGSSTGVSITVNPSTGLPPPWTNSDIGAVAAAGSASHSSGTFTVNGSGADIWGIADEFHYVYQPASGDVELIARVSSISNTNAWAKAGLMVRESLAAGSINAAVFVSSANGITFQRRTATGGTSVSTVVAGIPAPVWLKLTRAGNNFTASYSTNGTTYTTIGTAAVTMNASTQVGLAVTSHSDGVIATAPFTNVSVTGPVAPCPAVIDSGNDGNLPANVLDNDMLTRWSSSGDGQWIQFCLPNVSSVSGVQIAFYKGNERQSMFDVLVSMDGTTFTPASENRISSGTSLAFETFNFTPVNAKHVRILGHGNTLNLWNSYTEVKITAGAATLKTDEAIALDNGPLSSHPNPPSTGSSLVTITYKVEEAGRVTLSVYDAAKNRTTQLVDKKLDAGTYKMAYDTKELSSGVNVLKLVRKGKMVTYKLLKQ